MNIYIKQDGQESGPFTKVELLERIYSGTLARTVSARLDHCPDWVRLESLLNGSAIPVVYAGPPPLAVPLPQLRDAKEKTALLWLYIASVPVWLVLIAYTVMTLGIPLIVVGLIWLIRAFGEAWFMA